MRRKCLFFLFISLILTHSAFAVQTVVVVRHAESTKKAEGQDKNVHNGDLSKDKYPLTDNGRAQAAKSARKIAEETANEMPLRHVFVSPFQRTRETAQVILREWGLQVQPEIVDELREKNFGDLEGEDVNKPAPSANPADYGAETVEQIEQRVLSFTLSDAFKQALAAGLVLVVAHGGTTKALIKLLGGGDVSLKVAQYHICHPGL